MWGTTEILMKNVWHNGGPRGKAEYPRKDKEKEKERRKHDQKASNDIADWKWEKRRVTTRRVAATEELQ